MGFRNRYRKRFWNRGGAKKSLFGGFKSVAEMQALDKKISDHERVEGEKADADIDKAWAELEESKK